MDILKNARWPPFFVSRWLPVIDMGVISLSSEFQPCSSSNGWDMDNLKKSKMAAMFLVFENSKTIVWSRISMRFCRHLKILNPSIISHFITVCSFGEILVNNLRWPPCFLVFENSKTIVWSRMSIHFYRKLKIWNPSIISHFITVCNFSEILVKIQDGRHVF